MHARLYLFLFILGVWIVPSTYIHAQVAFPGAEGYGRNATGGRGGVICAVTNLNDSGSGSFRSCAERSGRRIIVFRTGGLVMLRSDIVFRHGDVTVMGQTAPGDGIAFGGRAIALYGDNYIIRNIRVYPGDPSGTPDNWDALKVYADNVILDHISIGWGSDENFQAWTLNNDPSENVTLQWSVITEGLNDPSFNPKGRHGYGMIVAPESNNYSVHHTIFTYNLGRSPLFYGSGRTEFINNSSDDYMDFASNSHLYHVINNYTRRGIRLNSSFGDANNRAYVTGTHVTNGSREWVAHSKGRVHQNFVVRNPVFTGTGIRTQSAVEADRLNSRYAGAIIPRKDSITERAARRSGRMINSMREVGGFPSYARGTYPTDSDGDHIPDAWERENGLNPNNSSDARAYSNRGYMWIEEYANSLIPMYGFTTNEGLEDGVHQGPTDNGNTDTWTNRTDSGKTQSSECGVYRHGSFPFLNRFAGPWNIFNHSENIITGRCSNTTVTVTAGTTNTAYTWSQAYYSNGSNLSPVSLTGNQSTSGWIKGAATGVIPLESRGTLFLTYICQYENNRWYCGCSDQNTCEKWNTQLFRQ